MSDDIISGMSAQGALSRQASESERLQQSSSSNNHLPPPPTITLRNCSLVIYKFKIFFNSFSFLSNNDFKSFIYEQKLLRRPSMTCLPLDPGLKCSDPLLYRTALEVTLPPEPEPHPVTSPSLVDANVNESQGDHEERTCFCGYFSEV